MLKQLDNLELESPHQQKALIGVAYGVMFKVSDAMHDKRTPLSQSEKPSPLSQTNFIDSLLDMARHPSILIVLIICHKSAAQSPLYQEKHGKLLISL